MKGENNEILESEVINSWWNRINASESTRIRYGEGMLHFFAFLKERELGLGSTPSEVLEFARVRVREDVLSWRDEIEGILADYEDWLRNKKKILSGKEQPTTLAPKTINNSVVAVRSFFNAFNIDVPKRKGRREVKPLVENNHRLTKDMVKEALKFADVREKAIALTMMTSGMGDSEILSLRVSYFIAGRGYRPDTITDLNGWITEEKKKCEDAINEGKLDYGITQFEIRRKKTTVDYYTFITPEATLAILDYMAQRNRESRHTKEKGTERLIEEKQKIRETDDYLFIKTTIDDWYLPPEDIERVRPPRKDQPIHRTASKVRIETVTAKRKELNLEGFADEIRKLDRTALMTSFRRLAKKAGIDTKYGVYQVLRGHNLRKLFYTLLRAEGVDTFELEYWMGHKLPDEKESYFQAIPEKMRKIYAKYMHVLFIGDIETRVLLSTEYAELSEELKETKEALKKRNGEIKKLHGELEALKAREADLKAQEGELATLKQQYEAQAKELKELSALVDRLEGGFDLAQLEKVVEGLLPEIVEAQARKIAAERKEE